MILTINAKDAEDLRAQLLQIANTFLTATTMPSVSLENSVSEEEGELLDENCANAAAMTDEEEPTIEAPKKVRKNKPAKKELSTNASDPFNVVDEDVDDEELLPPPVTAGKKTKPVAPASLSSGASAPTAMAMLQEVNSKKGLQTAREILAKFGCNRISEVTLEKEQSFIQACKKVLAS